jgi:L-cysteine desulfidase
MSRDGGSKGIADSIASIIESELKITVGCTDPAAIGLTTASAAAAYSEKMHIHALQDAVESIFLELDMNIYKNASAVGVPGTGMKGIPIAAVLGMLIHDTSGKLMIFSDLDSSLLTTAVELVKKIPVQVRVRNRPGNIYIQARITWKDGTVTASAVSDYHDNIIWVEIDGIRTPAAISGFREQEHEASQLLLDSLDWLVGHISLTPEKILGKIAESIEINMQASEIGLKEGSKSLEIQSLERIYGGIFPKEILETPENGNSQLISLRDAAIIQAARVRIAAATRVRMNGGTLPVMACGGSGNHGITLLITLAIGWSMEGIVPERSLLHGAALGILILHRIKAETGVLTPMCGCAVASGLAAAAVLAWGMGGDSGSMHQAMNLVFSSLGGVVCDGAKPACAFKTSLSAQISLESARMAISGVTIPSDEGLSTNSFPNLLTNLRRIHQEGMAAFNTTMVSLLQSRN